MEKSAINKIKSHILVVDDDNRLRKLLQKFLTDNSFSVDTAQNTSIARKKITAILYDIIILDVMMPGESGLSFLQYIRTISKTPILMLSAMKETKERIKGLEIGADDYLGKPFEPQELLLRIEAILRRTDERHLKSSIDNKITKFGDLIFDPKLSIIWKQKFKILLTKKECELLNELIKLHGKPVNRNMLARNLNLGSRRIDVTISRLRTKIENNPRNPIYILTIRGEGYLLSGIKS
tara:strand:+ start:342 stop:1052 length:711 start_codon:yes stop_codon:yes gene_type:complete